MAKAQFSILRERTFRHLFLGEAVSWLGTAITPVALAFAILDRGGSATDLGLVEAGSGVALVASLLVGGVLADRFARYRIMVACDLVAFAAQGAMAALFLAGTAPLGLVIALAAVIGAAGGVSYPCLKGLVPQVVDVTRVQSANALIQLAQNSTRLLGAAVSGVLVAGVGAGWGLAFNAVSFLLSAALVLTSGAPREVPPRPADANADAAAGADATAAEGPGAILADLRDGWREVRSRQWLWVCIAEFTVVNLCFSPSIQVLGPVVARQHYGGAVAWSVIVTAQAVGLVGGSLLAMRLRPAFPLLFATLITFGFLPPFFLLAVHAPVWLTALSMLGIGLCIDVYEVLWVTTMQENIPADKISRVASWDALGAFGLGPVGLLIVGPLAAALGTEHVLIGAGVLVGISTLAALATPSVRRLPSRPPQPAADALVQAP